MLKVILIDDQPRELDGIAKILPWESMGMRIVGTAKNGMDGLKLVEELKPDIVLSDVIMPNMDGLSLVKELHERFPDVKVICFSCFDDFKFVSSAINSGASGYVLKPVLARELEEVVSRVADDILAQKKQQKILQQFQGFQSDEGLLREALGLRLLHGGLSPKEITLILNAAGWKDSFIVAYFGNIISQQEFAAYIPEGAACLEQVENAVIVLFPWEEEAQKLEFILKEALSAASESLQIPVLLGVSRRCRAAWLDKAVEEAKQALQYAAQNEDHIGTAFSNYEKASQTYYMSQIRSDLKEVLNRRDIGIAEEFLRKYLPAGPIEELRRTALFLWMLLSEELEWERRSEYDDLYQKLQYVYLKEQTITFFLKSFPKLFEEMEEEIQDNIVVINKIKEYVRNHLAENISLKEMLKDFYFSSGYANVLFKKETGMTIHQYIVNERMNAAAQLLREKNNMKIYDVAAQVGYSDVAYFINVFKKIYGCTPTQYGCNRNKKNNE